MVCYAQLNAQGHPTTVKIPILMYHEISNTLSQKRIRSRLEGLVVRTSDFEKQIKYLKDSGYTSIEFKDIPNAAQYHKPIIITLDDGYKNSYTDAYPILRKYGMKATIFVIGRGIDGKYNHVNAVQIKEMYRSGLISIQNHTWSHRELPHLSEQALRREIEQCNAAIKCITQEDPYVLCYPSGKYNDAVVDVCKEYVTYCVTTKWGKYKEGQNPFEMKRIRISRDTDFSFFCSSI